jgi:hypothetical protein
MIHGVEEIGFAATGPDISTGSASLAWPATILSVAVTFDGSGGLIVAAGTSSVSDEQAARRKHSGNTNNLKCFSPASWKSNRQGEA